MYFYKLMLMIGNIYMHIVITRLIIYVYFYEYYISHIPIIEYIGTNKYFYKEYKFQIICY